MRRSSIRTSPSISCDLFVAFLLLLLLGSLVYGCGNAGNDGAEPAVQEAGEQTKLARSGAEPQPAFKLRTPAQRQVKAAVDEISVNENHAASLCRMMSEGSRQRLTDSARAAIGLDAGDLNCAKAVKIVRDRARSDGVALTGPIRVRSIRVEGGLAVVGIDESRPGGTNEIVLIREGGDWKLAVGAKR
jgi:hypothetical protein